jgi:hypothetical protein
LMALLYRIAGVPFRRIRITGWPHWEQRVATLGDLSSVARCVVPGFGRSLLIAPTGWGRTEPGSSRDVDFWRDARVLLSTTAGQTDVFLRMKAGDQSHHSALAFERTIECVCESGPIAIRTHGGVVTDSFTMVREAAYLGEKVWSLGPRDLSMRRFLVPKWNQSFYDVGGVWNSVLVRRVRFVMVTLNGVLNPRGSTGRAVALLQSQLSRPN